MSRPLRKSPPGTGSDLAATQPSASTGQPATSASPGWLRPPTAVPVLGSVATSAATSQSRPGVTDQPATALQPRSEPTQRPATTPHPGITAPVAATSQSHPEIIHPPVAVHQPIVRAGASLGQPASSHPDLDQTRPQAAAGSSADSSQRQPQQQPQHQYQQSMTQDRRARDQPMQHQPTQTHATPHHIPQQHGQPHHPSSHSRPDPSWIEPWEHQQRQPTPFIDPITTCTYEHNHYKISQDNHAMARRRVLYGNDVDEGFYGQVNLNPPGFNSDDDEVRLRNLREARGHAVNEINDRRVFVDRYYGGQQEGIEEQIRLRSMEVQEYDVQITRLQHHIDNPVKGPDHDPSSSGHGFHDEGQHDMANSHSGWWDEHEHEGHHKQDHDGTVIGYSVLHPGQQQYPESDHEMVFDEGGDGHGVDLNEHDRDDTEDAGQHSHADTRQGRSYRNPFARVAEAQWHGSPV